MLYCLTDEIQERKKENHDKIKLKLYVERIMSRWRGSDTQMKMDKVVNFFHYWNRIVLTVVSSVRI